MPGLPIIYTIDSMNDYKLMLQNNPGMIIVKLGAEWCIPCQRIDPVLQHVIPQMPENVQCVILDIDESFEVYAQLKNKKMVNGIPSVLAYYKGNVTIIPDDMNSGSNVDEWNAFFERCFKKAKE